MKSHIEHLSAEASGKNHSVLFVCGEQTFAGRVVSIADGFVHLDCACLVHVTGALSTANWWVNAEPCYEGRVSIAMSSIRWYMATWKPLQKSFKPVEGE